MIFFSRIKDRIKEYIDVQLRLLKINFIAHASKLMSSIIFMFICLFIFFCILFFLGFGIVELLVESGLSRAESFFVMIGIYILLLIVTMAMRVRITNFFSGIFIRSLTGEEDEKQPKP